MASNGTQNNQQRKQALQQLKMESASEVGLLTSGITGSHGVTGGVYKARERIHRGMLIRDY